jgi:hypothetical protein
VRIDEESVEVDFSCNCMTFDGSSKKLWHHGEYKPLSLRAYAKNKKTHDNVCTLDRVLTETM